MFTQKEASYRVRSSTISDCQAQETMWKAVWREMPGQALALLAIPHENLVNEVAYHVQPNQDQMIPAPDAF